MSTNNHLGIILGFSGYLKKRLISSFRLSSNFFSKVIISWVNDARVYAWYFFTTFHFYLCSTINDSVRHCYNWVYEQLFYFRISIRAGSHFNDLIEVEQIELNEPIGWICVPLKYNNGKPIRTFMIQIAVLSNHQNGRDTHVRRIKIRSPVQKYPMFTSLEFNMRANLR